MFKWLKPLRLYQGDTSTDLIHYRNGQVVLSELRWDTRAAIFALREPYPGVTSLSAAICGRIDGVSNFAMTSTMAEQGAIFSDGMLNASNTCIQRSPRMRKRPVNQVRNPRCHGTLSESFQSIAIATMGATHSTKEHRR